MNGGSSARSAFGTLVVLLVVLVQIAFFIAFVGTSFGVVREYCLDVPASRATNSVQVESSWTIILWPPLFFANSDPPGRCVRNAPLREALSALGVWTLPSPEEQVRGHIENQLASQRE
jgi:hypothetical protein